MTKAEESMGSARSVIVSGMVWIMDDPEAAGSPADEVLSGPAVGAAIGVRAAGARPELLVAIPDSHVGEARRFLRVLDPTGRLVGRRREPPLRWSTGPVVDEACRWTLAGDPRGWSGTCEPVELHGRIVVLANGNPYAYARMLKDAQPGYVAIDIDGCWVASQSSAIKECVRRARLVTITRRDHERLPPGFFAGTGSGGPSGPMLVIKAGAAGVELIAEGGRRVLPAPPVDGPVGTDVGAGDVLLGFLAARLGSTWVPPSLETLEAAYREATPVLSKLLRSAGFTRFADDILGT
jgi:hypothetical protein